VLDPCRVAAQIVSGIRFIGGGLIFVRGDAVRGLMTASVVWITAAIGMAWAPPGSPYSPSSPRSGNSSSSSSSPASLPRWSPSRSRSRGSRPPTATLAELPDVIEVAATDLSCSGD
jgi:hypothetical protein